MAALETIAAARPVIMRRRNPDDKPNHLTRIRWQAAANIPDNLERLGALLFTEAPNTLQQRDLFRQNDLPGVCNRIFAQPSGQFTTRPDIFAKKNAGKMLYRAPRAALQVDTMRGVGTILSEVWMGCNTGRPEDSLVLANTHFSGYDGGFGPPRIYTEGMTFNADIRKAPADTFLYEIGLGENRRTIGNVFTVQSKWDPNSFSTQFDGLTSSEVVHGWKLFNAWLFELDNINRGRSNIPESYIDQQRSDYANTIVFGGVAAEWIPDAGSHRPLYLGVSALGNKVAQGNLPIYNGKPGLLKDDSGPWYY